MKAVLVILTMWVNNPDGSQTDIYISEPMTEAQCLPMQKALWEVPFETIGDDSPIIDAACLPENL